MRFAIYYTPRRDEELNAAASAWLGRDAHTGRACRQPGLDWLEPADLRALTADPRRYGFHGTLKAPFRLKDEACLDDMIDEAERFAERSGPVLLDAGLKVSLLGPFFALVPVADDPALSAFASACVRTFEPFRAPLSADELQRRRKSGLTANQDAYLVRWGYPYIFDEFRFHMTLTGRVPEATRRQMLGELESRFAGFTAIPFRLDALSLFSQHGPDDAFRVEAMFPLKG